MPQRTPEHVRDAILADIRAGTKGRNRIARDHGVALSTVTKIARDAGLDDAFDRSKHKTAHATAAAVWDAKAARAQLAQDLLGDAQRMRERAWAPYTTVVGSGPGTTLVTLKLPPLRDQQAAYVAIAVQIDKSLTLERHDDDQGSDAARTMLNDLMGAFRLAHHQHVTEQDYDGDGDGAL